MIRSPVRSRVALVLVCAGTAPLVAQATGIQLTNGVDGGVVYQYDARFVPPTGITVEAWITYDDSTIPTGTYRWPTIARHTCPWAGSAGVLGSPRIPRTARTVGSKRMARSS